MDNIIQIRDHQSKRQREQAKAAIEIMNVALMRETIPFGGQGIDGMFTDTAPSEYCAPPEDCA